MPDVYCVGLLVADIVAKPVVRVPGPDEVAPIPVDTIELHTGGDAMNTTLALRKIGVDVGFVGRVGDDDLGTYLADQLARAGVDPLCVTCDPDLPTSACLVLVRPDGEHGFLFSAGANARLTPADVDIDTVCAGRFLHVGGALYLDGLDGQPMADLFRQARARGVHTSFDVGSPRGDNVDLIVPVLPHTDLFMPSIAEARLVARRDDPAEIARFLLDAGARTVVVKLGSRGCYVCTDQGGEFVPAFSVDVVDTCGAGDCFCAGVLAGLVQGWPIQRCARFACATSAFCVQALGANAGVRSMADILAFIERHERSIAPRDG